MNDTIGTYKEKTLHSVLKSHYEQDGRYHEIPYKGFIADVKRDKAIYEIQTAKFYTMKNKIKAFTVEDELTVVYPDPHIKKIVWIDQETGSATAPRKSPKVGSPYDIFAEIYTVRDQLDNPRLHFIEVLVDLTEYRYLCGWSADRKSGSRRAERIPESIFAEISLSSPEDYAYMIPDALGKCFTVADFAVAAGIRGVLAQKTIAVMKAVGAVVYCGKSGRRYLYTRRES